MGLTTCKGLGKIGAMVKITLEATELLSYTEATQILGISRPTIYNMVADGRLHIVSISRSKFLLRSEVIFLKSQLHGG